MTKIFYTNFFTSITIYGEYMARICSYTMPMRAVWDLLPEPEQLQALHSDHCIQGERAS